MTDKILTHFPVLEFSAPDRCLVGFCWHVPVFGLSVGIPKPKCGILSCIPRSLYCVEVLVRTDLDGLFPSNEVRFYAYVEFALYKKSRTYTNARTGEQTTVQPARLLRLTESHECQFALLGHVVSAPLAAVYEASDGYVALKDYVEHRERLLREARVTVGSKGNPK